MNAQATTTLIPPRAAAIVAAVGFSVIAAFQLALALGAPLGRAAWGGGHVRLPRGLRIASAVAVGIWILAVMIVLGRAGYTSPLPPGFVRWGMWILVGVLALGALMNFASPSSWERFIWGPVGVVLTVMCFLVARSGASATGG
jgi:hypothetical protein